MISNQTTICRLLSALVFMPLACFSQVTPDSVQRLAFDDPESWAMAYVTATTQFSGFGVPQKLARGEIQFAAEGGYIPHLSPSQRRVGLFGNKAEDLNKSPVFGRIRVTAGLPWGVVGEVGFVPPVQVNGTQPNNIWSAALGREIWAGDRWRFGARIYVQDGRVNGDITCDEDTVNAGLDPIINPFGCLERSNDEIQVDYYGAELSAAYKLPNQPLSTYITAALTRFDLQAQVDALTVDGIERPLLITAGEESTYTIGADYRFSDRWSLAGEIYYTPLEVNRVLQGISGTDAVLSARFLLRYNL